MKQTRNLTHRLIAFTLGHMLLLMFSASATDLHLHEEPMVLTETNLPAEDPPVIAPAAEHFEADSPVNISESETLVAEPQTETEPILEKHPIIIDFDAILDSETANGVVIVDKDMAGGEDTVIIRGRNASYSVVVEAAKDIRIEANTIIQGTGTSGLVVPDGAVVTGLGTGIRICSIDMDEPGCFGIDSTGEITIAGTIDRISGGIEAVQSVIISGHIGHIQGREGRYSIRADGAITLSGSIDCLNGGVSAAHDIVISGIVGTIESHSATEALRTDRNIEISGTVGNLFGGLDSGGIYAENNITIHGSVGTIKGGSALPSISAGNRLIITGKVGNITNGGSTRAICAQEYAVLIYHASSLSLEDCLPDGMCINFIYGPSSPANAPIQVYLSPHMRIPEFTVPAHNNRSISGWYADEALSSAWNFQEETNDSLVSLYAKWVTQMPALIGLGTAESPFLIQTAAELHTISVISQEGTNFSGTHFRLENNIQLPRPWLPIGNLNAPFQGIFDGNEKVVTGLIIGTHSSAAQSQYNGLFGYIGTDGIVKNVRIEASEIFGGEGSSNGGLAGVNAGHIMHCAASVNLSGALRSKNGGLVGENQGEISNSYATGSLTDSGHCTSGGLVGTNLGTIINGYATGNVNSGDDSQSGGLAGFNSHEISNCFTTGLIVGGKDSTNGGIVGTNQGAVTNCYAAGSVSGGINSGGVAGFSMGRIEDSYWNTAGVSAGIGLNLNNAASAIEGMLLTDMQTDDFQDKLNACTAADTARSTWERTHDTNNGLPFLGALPIPSNPESGTGGGSNEESGDKGSGTVDNSGNGSGGGDGGGGGGSSAPASPVADHINTDNKTNAPISGSEIQHAITAAGTAAAMELKAFAQADAKGAAAILSRDAISALVEHDVSALTINSDTAAITFDAASLHTIWGSSSGDVTVRMSKVEVDTLPDAAQKAIGNRPIYDFSVTNDGQTISDFGGTVTVAIPYTPAADEDTHAIIIYYINAEGVLEVVPSAYYDAESGMVIFTTTHFSRYAIGYRQLRFTDGNDTAWYANAASYMFARGLTIDNQAGAFDPDMTLSRGAFLALVLRVNNIDADADTANNFSDAKNSAYDGYIAAAKRLGIASGLDGDRFAPDAEITRQEMFVFVDRMHKTFATTASVMKTDPIADFSDCDAISDWAHQAASALVGEGLISGHGNALMPTGSVTHAQAVQLLYNILTK